MYPANAYLIHQASFPRDPNAPGGPGRSEFVRWTYATPKAPRPAG